MGTAPQTETIDTKALKVNASQEYVDASTPVFKDVEVQTFSLTPDMTLQSLAAQSGKEMERLEGMEKQAKLLKRGEANVFKRRLLKIWEAMNMPFEAGEKLVIGEDIFEGTGGKGLGAYLRWSAGAASILRIGATGSATSRRKM